MKLDKGAFFFKLICHSARNEELLSNSENLSYYRKKDTS